MRARLVLLGVLVSAFAFTPVALSQTNARPPGPGFFGIDANSVLLGGEVKLGAQLTAIRATGTGAIRFPVYWSESQPYQSWSDVPPSARAEFVNAGGRPTTFVLIDREVLAFARDGLKMLPVVLQAPPWARVQPDLLWSPPADPREYGQFVGALVRRYGARGTFWALHPRLARLAPRWWQIWNEPAGGETPDGPTLFWDGPEPYEPRYIAMLRAARAAALAADPYARILLAGFFGNSWGALARIYQYGGRGLFDGVAVHPYADTPEHVLTILQDVRGTLLRHRQSKLPLYVTETGWPSCEGQAGVVPAPIETTEAGQAASLAAEYPLLVANRKELNLQQIYWYTWIGSEPSSDPFEYAGLLRLTPSGQIQPKPALRAYKRTLHHLERL